MSPRSEKNTSDWGFLLDSFFKGFSFGFVDRIEEPSVPQEEEEDDDRSEASEVGN